MAVAISKNQELKQQRRGLRIVDGGGGIKAIPVLVTGNYECFLLFQHSSDN